jgi:hypothetical protein
LNGIRALNAYEAEAAGLIGKVSISAPRGTHPFSMGGERLDTRNPMSGEPVRNASALMA